LTRTDWIEKTPQFRDASGAGQRRFSVGRKGPGRALSQAHRRRTVGSPDVAGIARSAALSRLVEEYRLAVGGNVAHDRPVEPREVLLLLRPGKERRDALSCLLLDNEDPAARGDVLNGETSGRLREHPDGAAVSHRVDSAVETHGRGGKPHFVSVRRPGQSHDAREDLRDRLLLPGAVHERDGASVIRVYRMIDECDLVTARRDPGMTDPP